MQSFSSENGFMDIFANSKLDQLLQESKIIKNSKKWAILLFFRLEIYNTFTSNFLNTFKKWVKVGRQFVNGKRAHDIFLELFCLYQ